MPLSIPVRSCAHTCIPLLPPPADGGLYLATPLDPLLVALPLLERARAQQNVFQDLEQVLRCPPLRRVLLALAGLLPSAGQARVAPLRGWRRQLSKQRRPVHGSILAAAASSPRPLRSHVRAALPCYTACPPCSIAGSPSAHLLAGLLTEGGQLGCLCDVKAAGGQSYYRLNDDKVGNRKSGRKEFARVLGGALSRAARGLLPLSS